MNNLTVFIAFSLLVVFACAQSNANFDFRPRAGGRISLGSPVRDTNSVNSVKFGVVEEQVITGCEEVTHQVSGVQSNVGPLNSGSKFMVEVTISVDSVGAGPLAVTFGTTGQAPSFEIWDLGVITGPDGVQHYYFCNNYPSSTTLEVRISSDGLTDPVTYSVEVTQYVSDIRSIPAGRTLRQSSGVINLLTEADDIDDPTHVAGQNFVHYYHKLQPSLSESRAKLVVELDNWNWEALGDGPRTAYLCVAFDTLVMFNGDVAPNAAAYTGDVDFAAADNVGNPCSIWCVSGDILDETSDLRLPIGVCEDTSAIGGTATDCGFPENIWIGVITPSAEVKSTFDISISFLEDTLINVGTIPAGNGHVQGFLSDECENPDACEDYYDILPPSSSSATQFGPFLALELYAVNNGQASFDIYDGHVITDACGCTPSLGGCAAIGEGLEEYCTFILHPCRYDRTVDYTLVVKAVGDEVEDGGTIEYALDSFVGSWPVETVTASSFNKPSFGTVKPNYYHHYQITFTADQIEASSYFQTELYTLHEEDALEFFWKFGGAAGRTTECFDYDGLCTTNSDCEDHSALDNTGHCRFLFVPCEVEELYEEFAEMAFEYVADPLAPMFDGLKVAKLQAGTYYFAVRGKPAPSVNVKNEYTYTITWNLQHEVPVFDGVPVPNSVYLLDFSQQYVFTLPKEQQLYRLRVRTSYVFNGFVETTLSCTAGFCPCGGISETVTTGLNTPFMDTFGNFDPDDPFFGYSSDIYFDPICRGCSDKIYITVRGSAGPELFGYFEDPHKPIPYVLTVHIEPFSKVPVPILTASRAGYHHNDEIRRSIDSVDLHTYQEEPYDDWARYYKVSFANAEDFRNDAFFVDLTIVPGIAGIKSLLDFYYGSPSASVEIVTLNDCIVHGICFAGTYPGDLVNFNYYYGPFSNYYNAYDVTQGTCRVALQPCHSDSCATNTCSSTVEDSNPDLTEPYPTTGFDRNLEYYIIVRDWAHPTALFAGYPDFTLDSAIGLFPRLIDDMSNIFFKLSLQIVEQTPLSLTVNQPIYGHVGAKQYVHFRYDVGSVPANSKLVFEMYKNHNDDETLIFYMNYWDGSSPEVWAGETYDCLGTECGRKCVLAHTQIDDGEVDSDFCTFEVSPCELKGRTGTYFLSVSSGTQDWVWGTSTFGVQDTEFTVSAKHVAPIELLGSSNTEGVERGLLRLGTSLYYSVTVPRISSGVVGRILNLEVENVLYGNIAVTFSEETPQNQCGCITSFTNEILEDTMRTVLRRVPCQVTDTSTFYITVTALTQTDCNPVGFVLRALLDDITERSITLAADRNRESLFARTILRFDSDAENNPLNEFFIRPNEIVALTWSTSSPAGSVMRIEVTQDNDVLPIPVTLGAGKFVVPPAAAALFPTFGPVPDDSDCGLPIWGGLLEADLDSELFVDACEFPNTNTKWWLMFSGEDITDNSGIITVKIRVIPPENLVDVPATNNFDDPGVTSGPSEDITLLLDEELSLVRRVITSDSFGLSAGQSARFDFTGVANVRINYGAETNQDDGCPFVCEGTTCVVQVCANLSPKAWYFNVEQTGEITAEVTRIAAPFESSNLQVTTVRANSEVTFDLESDSEWKYFRLTIPKGSNSAFEFVENGVVDYFQVDTPVFMPGAITTADVLLAGDGSILVENTCGGMTWTPLEPAQCCIDAVDVTFAVTGATVVDEPILLRTASLEGTTGTLSFGSSTSRTVGGTTVTTAGKQGYFTFTVPENTGFYYEFEVTSEDSTAQFYLGRSRAGTGNDFNFDFDFPAEFPDYSGCYVADGTEVLDVEIAFGDEPSTGFVDPCVDAACNAGTWVLTVIPTAGDGRVQFSSRLVQLKAESAELRTSATVNLNADIADVVADIDLYTSYVYNFKTQNNNWIPTDSDPLFGGIDYLPARLVFEIDTIRIDGTAVPIAADADIEFYMSETYQCGVAGDAFDGNCFDEGALVVVDDDTIRCAKSFCDLTCGSSFYLSAERGDNTLPASFRYSTSIANPQLVSNLVDIETVSVSRTSVSRTWSNGRFSAVYFKVTYDLEPNSWVNILIDNVESDDEDIPTPLGDLSFQRMNFNGGTCFDFGDAVDLCTLEVGVDCVYTTPEDERCSQATSDLFKYPVYYRIGYDNAIDEDFVFSFRITFQVQTTSPMIDSGTATTLQSGETYEKLKYIPENTWQFYTFKLEPELGYDHFTFDIEVLNCDAAPLEVYTSWLDSDTEVHDWVRVQWPLFDDCAAGFDAFSYPLSSCHTFGGEYRVAIYAPEDSALIEGGEIVYSITAKLVNVPHLDLTPYCPLSQVYDGNFVQRYELLVDASNRGSLLSFHATSTDPEITNLYTLWISKNANPFPSPNTDICGAWDDTVSGYYSVEFTSDSNLDFSVPIDVCDFENDVWYLYVSGPVVDPDAEPVVEYGEVTIWAEFETHYIPVEELSGETSGVVSWSATLAAGASQTYKVLVNQPIDQPINEFFLLASLSPPEGDCVDIPEDCDFELYYKTGSSGYAPIGGGESPRDCTGCDGDCEDCAVTECESLVCCIPNTYKEYFFTVTSVAATSNCQYVLEVSLTEPVPLAVGDELCVELDSVEILSVVASYSIPANAGSVEIIYPTGSLSVGIVDAAECGESPVICTPDVAMPCVVPNLACGPLVITLVSSVDFDCGLTYSLKVLPAFIGEDGEELPILPITLGRPFVVSEDEPAVFGTFTVTTPVVFENPEAAPAYSFGINSCSMAECDGDKVVVYPVEDKSTPYYFDSPNGLVLQAASAPRALTASGLVVDFEDSDIQHFAINLPAGVYGYSIVISEMTVEEGDLQFGFSSTRVPFTECYCGFDDAEPLPAAVGTCESELRYSFSCVTERTNWLSISNCPATCGASFRIRVIFDAASQLPTISGNHNTAYTVLDNDLSVCGGVLPESVSYIVDVTDILSVSLRNSIGGPSTISVKPYCGEDVAEQCTVGVVDSTYETYSCRIAESCDEAHDFSCYAPGLYEITVTLPVGTLSQYAEFLVVNQWVPLTGNMQDTIIGAEKHFYSVSAPGSLSVSLSISSGPALKFVVFDGCMTVEDGAVFSGFSEAQVCASDCHIWIPTEAKHSAKSTYYIEIESHSIINAEVVRYDPNSNNEVEKTTSYTISSKVGTNNCAAPPSSGFCASTDFEGVNVWSSITTASVWSFVDPVAKDNEAKCRFESYLTGCSGSSAQCRSWLKIYSCLTSFPQCDASGFQTGICTDVCSKVSEYCGDIGINCCSDQFVDSVEGSTCYTIPPPPPPTTVSELPELGGLGFDEFPPSLDTPVFSTIQVYLPPADELFENIPFLKEAVVGQDVSPAALLVPGFVFCVLLVLGLF